MGQNNKKVAFYTLGCRVNQYETGAVEEAFKKLGFEIASFDEKCDAYVINTCTVTAESDRKSRQMIRRARKNGGRDAVVCVMGCMTQVLEKDTGILDTADFAVGTRNKMLIPDKVCELLSHKAEKREKLLKTDFAKNSAMEKMQITESDTTRAFLKISDGCDNNCSYCIIPKARGPVCSKSREDVCLEVKALCANGWREVVLTGIETAAYGRDLNGINLAYVVEEVNQLDCGLERIRLGSLEPAFVKPEIVKRFALCEKLMPHYHLSLQSGSDRILAAMRRKYNTTQFYKTVCTLREHIPDVTFTTDIIVGFPGETEEMFKETCDFVRKCEFLFAHIFPYSDRSGTDASKMSNKLSDSEKKYRAAVLKQVMLETRRKVLAQYEGRERKVLVETVENGIAAGHTDNFIEVKFKTENDTGILKNSLVTVTLVKPSENLEFVNAEITKERRR